jgi:hypothetical protein
LFIYIYAIDSEFRQSVKCFIEIINKFDELKQKRSKEREKNYKQIKDSLTDTKGKENKQLSY